MDDVRAFARAADGTETDITEGVQALYDLVIGSMDFRSGFWTAEDAAPVAKLARLLGFKEAEEIERYLREQLHSEQQHAFLTERGMSAPWGNYEDLPHDHVFSVAGKCMWPFCRTRQEAQPLVDEGV